MTSSLKSFQKNVFEHTQSNVLVIPQALYAMKDVSALLHHQHSAIFYKQLEQDLEDIEFYTNTPCFVYIESGTEVLTNAEGHQVVLKAGSGIFLPKGWNLHSTFVKKTSALKAFLVFFGEEVIEDYLAASTQKPLLETLQSKHTDVFCTVKQTRVFAQYFNALNLDIKQPDFLKIKLIELLYLIASEIDTALFHPLLQQRNTLTPKRNLVRLLENQAVLKLSVADLAALSGRSLSTFNRDFKAIYQQPPKQWLQHRRLCYAKSVLEQSQLSVTEVAMLIGYENVSNFIKAFKSKFGQTPKQIKSLN